MSDSSLELTRATFPDYIKNNPEVIVSALRAVRSGVRDGSFPTSEVDSNVLDTFMAMCEMVETLEKQPNIHAAMVAHETLMKNFLDFLTIDVILDYLWEQLKSANSSN